MFAAKHYIRVNGRRYVAGELLPEGLPQEKLDWLLRAGAIAPVAEGGAEAADMTAPPADFSDKGEAGGETEAEEETPETEIDTEAEPEEIDAAEGIVPAPAPARKAKAAAKAKGGRAK